MSKRVPRKNRGILLPCNCCCSFKRHKKIRKDMTNILFQCLICGQNRVVRIDKLSQIRMKSKKQNE